MIKQKLNDFTLIVEDKLNSELSAHDNSFAMHYKAMQYSVLAGGKRLRPFIMSVFYKASGGKGDHFLNFAAALEMIHTYSLIHDDLPCMDNDDMRRGKPSCHKAFGETTALLAGDALLTKAFETAANTKNIDASLVVKAISVLANLAGADGMIGGQVIDLAIEQKTPELDVVTQMYNKKTGALLVAAAKIGVILAGGDEKTQKSAETYASSLGIAFQIVDDLLDLVGDSKLLGKPVGSDEKNQKSTYVSIVGIEKAKADVVKYTNRAKSALECFGDKAEDLLLLAEYLINRNS